MMFSYANNHPALGLLDTSKLILFKAAVSVYPIILLGVGTYHVHDLRRNNYMCGDEGDPIPDKKPDEGVWYFFYCALLVTYALELLYIPAVVAKHIILLLKANRVALRIHKGRDREAAERFEYWTGMALKLLQCITRDSAQFRHNGELREFGLQFVSAYYMHIVSLAVRVSVSNSSFLALPRILRYLDGADEL